MTPEQMEFNRKKCGKRPFDTLIEAEDARLEILGSGRYKACSYQWHVICQAYHLIVVPKEQ